MFTHRDEMATQTFVRLNTSAEKSLSLTHGHYLYINNRLATARSAKAGDMLTSHDGTPVRITAVSTHEGKGLYNPHTLAGEIVVDGVLTSVYTDLLQPAFADLCMWPFRALFSLGINIVGDFFDKGFPLLASILPAGASSY